MSGSGAAGFVGFAPVVTVVERMLISQVPEGERESFMEFVGDRADKTRSGEAVFAKELYTKWKSLS